MGGKRILSDDQLTEMCEWREAGVPCAQIAARFARQGTEISAGSIRWQCLREGAYSPKARLRPERRDVPAMRNGFAVRPFSEDDDRRLLDLESQGLNYSEIARRLSRQPNSIRGRLYTLAQYEAVAEAA